MMPGSPVGSEYELGKTVRSRVHLDPIEIEVRTGQRSTGRGGPPTGADHRCPLKEEDGDQEDHQRACQSSLLWEGITLATVSTSDRGREEPASEGRKGRTLQNFADALPAFQKLCVSPDCLRWSMWVERNLRGVPRVPGDLRDTNPRDPSLGEGSPLTCRRMTPKMRFLRDLGTNETWQSSPTSYHLDSCSLTWGSFS